MITQDAFITVFKSQSLALPRLSISAQERKHVSRPPVYRKVLETIDLVAPNRIQAVSGNKEKEPKCILCLVSKLFLHIIHVFHSLESWLSRQG